MLTVAGVGLGAETREVVWVPWAMLVVAILGDLLASFPGRRAADVDFPAEIYVGETQSFGISLRGVPEKAIGAVDWPKGLNGPPEFAFQSSIDGDVQADVPLTANRRGTWPVTRLWLRWPTRFGLLEFVPVLKLNLNISVVPNVRLVQSGLITSQVVSTLFGAKENRAIGEGSEFHQLRDFVPGMDTNSIDWKRSAHRGNLVAKELRAERNHHIIVAIDNGYLMGEEIAGLPKIDHAITAALATAWAAAIGGDLVGFFSYDSRPRAFSAPEPGRAAFARLRSRTASLKYSTSDTNHTLAMAALNARTPKRSLIIVFTDFIDTTSAELLVENIRMLTKRHLVIFVAMRDPSVGRLTEMPPQSLRDVSRVVSANQILQERRQVFGKLARLGVTVLDTEPGQVTARLISTYLEIKAAELI